MPPELRSLNKKSLYDAQGKASLTLVGQLVKSMAKSLLIKPG
ncbi:MAG: hypothetical protein ABSG01_07100 [Anaerolineales bacterium]